ncbi:sulfotransferase family 2 domain-containing protein [Mesobaculum littorinae]|nr:sulfotransferase family 2 domain-containing protein [Mesobaculum littorinae]
MLYFDKQALVFLAVPKTGTTAVEAALRGRAGLEATSPPGLKHMTVPVYRRKMEPILTRHGPRPEVFLVLREPVDRLLSWYRYRSRDEARGSPRSAAGVTAEEFLLETLVPTPRPFAQIGSQDRFVGAGEDVAPPDHVFAYEAWDRFEAFLAERFGKVELPRRNQSPDRAAAVSDEVAARVRAARAGEVALHHAALERV